MSKKELIARLKELVKGDNLNNYWLKEKKFGIIKYGYVIYLNTNFIILL